MYSLIKSILFLWPPEKAHHLTMRLLGLVVAVPGGKWLLRTLFSAPADPVTVAGITFPNRVGLAAGFDKDARYIDLLALLGFGSIEIGTLTPKPQDGNDKPRLFRLPADEALINRMGFNNLGVHAAVEELKKVRSNIIIGGNIGKNKVTPNEEAFNDYAICFKALYDHVHYFAVNVSSPNTPGLRELQERPALEKILRGLQDIRAEFVRSGKPRRPIFLKIAPDLTHSQLDEIVDMALDIQLDGLIATNTTISRENLKTPASVIKKIGSGGLSGKPVKAFSDHVLDYICCRSKGQFPVIGVGGIHSARDAADKIQLGATLVQVYTGFIYEGPGLVRGIVRGLGKK